MLEFGDAQLLDLMSANALTALADLADSKIVPATGALSIAGAALRVGRLDAAERLAQHGHEQAREAGFALFGGRYLELLSDIAERRGELELAQEYLDRAAAVLSRRGAKLYLDRFAAKQAGLRA